MMDLLQIRHLCFGEETKLICFELKLHPLNKRELISELFSFILLFLVPCLILLSRSSAGLNQPRAPISPLLLAVGA